MFSVKIRSMKIFSSKRFTGKNTAAENFAGCTICRMVRLTKMIVQLFFSYLTTNIYFSWSSYDSSGSSIFCHDGNVSNGNSSSIQWSSNFVAQRNWRGNKTKYKRIRETIDLVNRRKISERWFGTRVGREIERKTKCQIFLVLEWFQTGDCHFDQLRL